MAIQKGKTRHQCECFDKIVKFIQSVVGDDPDCDSVCTDSGVCLVTLNFKIPAEAKTLPVFKCKVCNKEYALKADAEKCEQSEHRIARRPTPPRIASKYNDYHGWSGPCHEGAVG